jgi:hypothetical protein
MRRELRDGGGNRRNGHQRAGRRGGAFSFASALALVLPIAAVALGAASATPAAAKPSPRPTASAIQITSSSNISSFAGVGSPVTYTYTVTNTGKDVLNSVHVTDPTAGESPVSCPDSLLVPGTSETCTASYTATDNDRAAGRITNMATATGDPPFGPPVTASHSMTIPVSAPFCYVGPWPTEVTGYPVVPVGAHLRPQGFFVGVVDNVWTVFTHSAVGSHRYMGTITTDGTFTDVKPLDLEQPDHFTFTGGNTITFSFHTAGDLDGIQFTSTCGDHVTIGPLTIDHPAGRVPKVYDGNPTTPAASNPETFARL